MSETKKRRKKSEDVSTLSFKKPRKSKTRNTSLVPLTKLYEREQQEYPMPYPIHSSISAVQSFQPQKKYCDITGWETPYVDPQTNLR